MTGLSLRSDLEIFLHGFSDVGDVMRRSDQVVSGIEHRLHRQMGHPERWETEIWIKRDILPILNMQFVRFFMFCVSPRLPDPSSPIMWPQPPQPICEPSGFTNLQLEPVPDISTTPPTERRRLWAERTWGDRAIKLENVQYKCYLLYRATPEEGKVSTFALLKRFQVMISHCTIVEHQNPQ